VVLTIPKRLRLYFRHDRRLLADLARTAARAITDVVRVSTGQPEGAPGLILALRAFGQDLTFHPNLHVLATEGLVRPDDTFVPVPTIDAPLLEHALRRRVFNLCCAAQRLRYYDAYAPRARCARRLRLAADSPPPVRPRDDSPAARARRLTWAQLLRRTRQSSNTWGDRTLQL
jgi:hypothetical protein